MAHLPKSKTVLAAYCGVFLAVIGIGILVLRSIDRTRSNYSTLVLVVLAFIGIGIILWFVPKLQTGNITFSEDKDRFDTENEARKSLAQLLGGLAFLATFYVTWANFSIERDKAATEEFTKAVEQISKPEIPIRIGGAYALERLSRSSPPDYTNAINVLTETIRESEQTGFDTRMAQKPADRPKADDDRQVIIQILGRRVTPSTDPKSALNLSHADLRGIFGRDGNFEWADFDGADFRTASFYGTRLAHASFIGANGELLAIKDPDLIQKNQAAIEATQNQPPSTCQIPDILTSQLRGVSFAQADLTGAHFDSAQLSGSTFSNATLAGTIFKYAQLQRATFQGADLRGADFSYAHLEGADFSGAKGLTDSQLSSATTDSCTRGIKANPSH